MKKLNELLTRYVGTVFKTRYGMKDRKDGKMRKNTKAVFVRPYGKEKILEFQKKKKTPDRSNSV